MNDCMSAEMRDRLPDLIHGTLDPAKTAEVEAHVASCAECATEIELLRAVAASRPAAPAIDIRRIAAAIPTPTRQGFLLHTGDAQATAVAGPSRPRTGWSRPSLRIAATVAIVTAGGLSLLVGRDVLSPQRQVGQPTTRVASGDEPGATTPNGNAGSGGSVSVAQQRGPQVAVATSPGLSLLGEVPELSDEHLTALIGEMDRIEAIPEAEPETVSPLVGESDSSGGLLTVLDGNGGAR